MSLSVNPCVPKVLVVQHFVWPNQNRLIIIPISLLLVEHRPHIYHRTDLKLHAKEPNSTELLRLILLTWINYNASMDMFSHAQQCVG